MATSVGSASIAPRTFTVWQPAEFAQCRGVLFMALPEGPRGWQRGAKRGLDIVTAALLILVCAPLMAAVAVVIKLTSPGPVVIKQERVGRNHVRFHLYKFRSMVAGAETLRAQLSDLNEAAAPLFKIRRDPRITRVGKLIRRFSLDELPQLVNVLL